MSDVGPIGEQPAHPAVLPPTALDTSVEAASARSYFNALISDIGVMLAHARARGIIIPDDLAQMIALLTRSNEFRHDPHPRFGSHRS